MQYLRQYNEQNELTFHNGKAGAGGKDLYLQYDRQPAPNQKKKIQKFGYYLGHVLRNWQNLKKVKDEEEIKKRRLLVEYNSLSHYK